MRTSQPAVRALPAPPTLLGAVRRSLLVAPDGTRDMTSSVTWLQGPSLYVDLRVPAEPTAPREGFAGRWSVDGDLARWTRLVDVAPPERAGDQTPDEGRLRWDGDVLVEDGVHVAYTEHWHLPPASGERAGGWLLARGERGERVDRGERVERDPAVGVLVRVGDLFGWAAHDDRGPWVAMGRVEAGSWRVTSATRPDAEGSDLAARADLGGADLGGVDLGGADLAGVVVAGQSWQVIESEGDAALN